MTPSWGDDRSRQLLAGDPAEIAAALDALRGDDTWDDRAFYVDALGAALSLDLLDRWCEREPASATAHLVRGRARIEMASNVRGGQVVGQTSTSQLRGFEDWLAAADEDLVLASTLDPDDPVAFAFRIRIAQGAGRGATAGRALFEELCDREPRLYWGHHAMLMAVTAKWGGSHEQMFEVARTAGPRGALLPMLVATAHLERWISFQMDGDRSGSIKYASDAAVRDEIARAVAEVTAAGLFGTRPAAAALPLNALALWSFMVRDVGQLCHALDLLGTTLTPYPWTYLDGLDTVVEARAAAAAYAAR